MRISYLGLSSVYNVVNAYDFSLAAAEVRCLCNCPGGANTCDADTQRWARNKCLQNVISTTQAGLGRLT